MCVLIVDASVMGLKQFSRLAEKPVEVLPSSITQNLHHTSATFPVAGDGQNKNVMCFRAAIDIAKGSELYVDYMGSEHVVRA